MEEMNLWKNFAASGKIEDYIKYVQMKQRDGTEGKNAVSNGWPDYPRERGGGK